MTSRASSTSARAAYLGERASIDITLEQLVEMAGEVSAQLELTRRVAEGRNDPHFRELLVLVLEKAADDTEDAAGSADDTVDLLDRAGVAPFGAITAGAIAAIVATGGSFLPALVLVAGALSLGALGVLRTALKSRSRRQKAGARRRRGLADGLRAKV